MRRVGAWRERFDLAPQAIVESARDRATIERGVGINLDAGQRAAGRAGRFDGRLSGIACSLARRGGLHSRIAVRIVVGCRSALTVRIGCLHRKQALCGIVGRPGVLPQRVPGIGLEAAGALVDRAGGVVGVGPGSAHKLRSSSERAASIAVEAGIRRAHAIDRRHGVAVIVIAGIGRDSRRAIATGSIGLDRRRPSSCRLRHTTGHAFVIRGIQAVPGVAIIIDNLSMDGMMHVIVDRAIDCRIGNGVGGIDRARRRVGAGDDLLRQIMEFPGDQAAAGTVIIIDIAVLDPRRVGVGRASQFIEGRFGA